MKRIMKIAAVAFVVFLGSSWRSTASAQTYDDNYYNDGGNYDNNYNDNYDQYQQPQQDVDYQTFYDELSPHGRWVQHPQYGYVWIPNLGNEFRPYSTGGHWVWTDNYEWMWVSDYDWGWAPFHYGRWYSDPYYGWAWVPGYEWSPAWVAWRDGGDYYGWAPIQPGINISIGFNIGSYSPPYDYWCFTPRRYITSPRIYDHYIDRRQNVTIINQTTIINNFNYNRNVFRTGPRRADVEIYAGRITPVRFAPSSRPGRTVVRNNQINIYRPQINRTGGRSSAPRNFERYDRQRTASNGRVNNDRGNNRTFDRNNNNNDNNGRVRNGNNLPRPERNGNVEGRNRERTGNDNPFNRQRNADVNNNPGRNPNREMRTPSERPQRNPGSMDNPGRQRTERPGQPVRQPNENRVFRQERPQSPQADRQPQVREQRPSQPQVREQRQPQMREQRQPQVREQRQSMPQQQSQPRQFERRSNNSGGGEMRGGGNGNGGGRRGGRQ